MKKPIKRIFYVFLLVLWVGFLLWQSAEHRRTRQASRQALLNRARDISNTIGIFIRSQERFGVVSRERVESSLQELLKMQELLAVALVTSNGDVVASAGQVELLDVDKENGKVGGWGKRENADVWMPGMSGAVTVMNLVDLGRQDAVGERSGQVTSIVILPPREEREEREDPEERDEREEPERRPAPRTLDWGTTETIRIGRHHPFRSELIRTSETVILKAEFAPEVLEEEPPAVGGRPRPPSPDWGTTETIRIGRYHPLSSEVVRTSESVRLTAEFPPEVLEQEVRAPGRRPWTSGRSSGFRRPFWMSESEYQALQEKQGLHGFLLRIDTTGYQAAIDRDFLLRALIVVLMTLALAMMAAAWRNFQRSAGLEMRLVRSSEMNIHLKEMNLSAAGLAHETRNPLNTVRGLAQVITRDPDAPDKVRQNSDAIVREVDRVTVRLNEFIEYSRPREPHPRPINLKELAAEVMRALETDIEDKSLSWEIQGPELVVMADEALLRQVLFNLLLNAVQAVDNDGKVVFRLSEAGNHQAAFEVIDNGPGVAPDAREDIFRPYFTTNEKGTGLGLAIVRQIVLAHHWEVEYTDNDPQGAVFRVSGLNVAAS